MPWKEQDVMTLREQFIAEALQQIASLASLCRKYAISRPTAYKWLNRYKNDKHFGLQDVSRRPLSCPTKTKQSIEAIIVAARQQFPAWGGRKLRHYLIRKGHVNLPCEATFNRILHRYGKISPEASELCEHYTRFERSLPNELWQMDFKGNFKLIEGKCHPLTVLDDHSRYSICLKACLGETHDNVRKALEEAFREYGLPEAMTMDNGAPWKGSAPWHLSVLTVWLMRLGIKVGHSTPYHPQTQGKDERFHRSLKEEVLRFHQFNGLQDAQEQFDIWRRIYNEERPHEGIQMLCPCDRYSPSKRQYHEKLAPLEYKKGDIVRKVEASGLANFQGKRYFLGEHLKGEHVAFRETKDGQFDIYFSMTRLQRIDLKNQQKV